MWRYISDTVYIFVYYTHFPGNLHFSYVLKSDERDGSTAYKCAISNIKSNVIRLGNENSLTVTSTGPIPNSAPKLQYSTSVSFLTVEVGKNATLECVFSGYVSSSIPSETVPRVTWYDQDGRAITQGGHYDITSNGRILTIMNVTEDDEKTYRCRGTNSLGADEGNLALNVTSRPIWVHRLESTTVVEGKDAVFHCVTRSAKGEQSPSQPKWALNTNQMGSTYDPNKHQFNADRTTLTVKFVNKNRDISCYQCTVANSVGMVHDDGCVNVIKPIEIKVRPATEQSVMKGDEVDLTVVATTDPLYAPNMTYSWIFKNVSYTDDRVPPYVTFDSVSKRAYISTSGLTDEEFRSIGGIYRRVISHPVETVHVDVSVEAEHVPVDHTECGSESGSPSFTNTLLNRVLSKIEEQSEVLQDVVRKLNQITLLLQNVKEDGLSLPLTNEQEIERMEEELMDERFRTKMVQHLSRIGGDSVTSLTRRILRRLFSPELAQRYNFSGCDGKNSFQSLQLRSVLFDAVRKTFAGTCISEAEVNGIARKWFGNARNMD
ncbi:uncharacterized protein LOC112561967 [Pomacea canaliculata]|uniref:uncharacterized protein LOC112561967 n=1 Tax=Pomacea canaliculata TaxID=400727 RepID=UPI000D73ECDA|nr:uncharacterized protein LOC112561967 [Pomacea canaliculata]